MNIRQDTKNFLLYAFLFFVLVFTLRLVYGYQIHPNQMREQSSFRYQNRLNEETFSVSKKNYASDSYKYKNAPKLLQGMPIKTEQKYEKTAEIVAKSDQFNKQDREVRSLIDKHNGIIQYENKKGLDKSRILYLLIGIPPAQFDSFYDSMEKIDGITSKNIIKTDKTNEFLNLKAQRTSLEETRQALIELKKHNGRIEELVTLQEKILTIEQNLQQLGVQLGEYDEINEFCTVRLTLYEENKILISPPSFIRRVIIALRWTVKIYAGISIGLFFMAVSIRLLWAMTRQILRPRHLKGEKEKTKD